jgi:hypothetical protein
MTSTDDAQLHPARRVEPDRVHLRGYYTTLLGAALLVLLSVVAAFAFFNVIEHAPPQASVALVRPEPASAEPRLQVDPPGELQAMHAAERARLSSYGWVDRRQGIVHLPIERAMELLLEHGVPAREAPQQKTGPGSP